MGHERSTAVKVARSAVLTLLAVLVACARHSSIAAPSRAPGSSSDGGALYETHCSSCHQLDGRGLAGVFPPLAGDAVVEGDARRAITTVAFGTRGRIAIGGRTYEGVMPGWAADLSDDQIAAIVTYVRGAWHNHAPPVSAADVATVVAH